MSHTQASGPLLALIGPTAIGKTALSLDIAARFGCEIISMDSMQVYRFMDIGTAKANREEQGRIAHHLLDLVNPDEQYHAARFVDDALSAIGRIAGRGKIPLLVGGTGLYLAALLRGLFDLPQIDPKLRAELLERLRRHGTPRLHAELQQVDAESAGRIHPHDSQRILRALEIWRGTGIPWSEHLRRQKHKASVLLGPVLLLGLNCDRALLYARINERSAAMIDQPFRDEVSALLAHGYGEELASMQAIGYRHMLKHLRGEWDQAATVAELAKDTRRYAKRQLTWFRSWQELHWHDPTDPAPILHRIDQFIQTHALHTSR